MNVNSETKALNNMCKIPIAFVEFSAYFYFYREAVAGCESFKSLITFSERKATVLAFGYALHEH